MDLVVGDVAQVAAQLLGDQIPVVDQQTLKRQSQRCDRPAQLDHAAFEQVDRLHIGATARSERHLLDVVDVGLHQPGHLQVVVDHVVGDRVQHRVGAVAHMLRVGVHRPANLPEPAVVAVAHRDREVLADKDHDLAGLHDLAGQVHRIVGHVVDGFEHQEQRVVVALQFGALMGENRVLGCQRVQPKNGGDTVHLGRVGFVQPDPDEAPLAGPTGVAHRGQRRGGGVAARLAYPVEVDAAVDDDLCHRPRRLFTRRRWRVVANIAAQ